MGQAVETLSGGQRQGVAVARAAAFGSRVLIMDEPTAALGVRESGRVLQLIRDVRDRGLPVILISHNMPARVRGRGPDPHPSPGPADRGRHARAGHTMTEAVAIMTGALDPRTIGAATDPAATRAPRRPELREAGVRPEVDAAVGRVAVDLGELLGAERRPVERLAGCPPAGPPSWRRRART